MFPSLELKTVFQVHVLSFYTILKKILPVIYENVYRQKNRGGGLRKKNKPRNKKNKTKKPPHSLLETEDLNNLIWG